MANTVKQFYPYNPESSFDSTFKVLIISEGYTTSEEHLFYKDVLSVWNKIQNKYPFSASRHFFDRMALYASFSPSNSHGYASSAANAVGYNLFETYYDTASQQLALNNTLLDTYLENCELLKGNNIVELKSYLFKGNKVSFSALNLLVVVLLPTSGNLQAEKEIFTPDYYYALVTSKDGYTEQLFFRGIGRLLGLGDEFEKSGSGYNQPTAGDGNGLNAIYPNLYYNNTGISPNPATDDNFKWRHEFPKEYAQPVPMHSFPGTINQLPNNQLSYPIELWEGGGGYRHHIYRSAYDCIMRREIGNISLPIKNKSIDLCPICTAFFERF